MRSVSFAAFLLLPLFAAVGESPDGWAQWRGPNNDGMARGDAPLHWSDTEHIKWKTEIPGRGHSSPVIWGDRVFITTAVPTSVVPAKTPAPPTEGGRGGRGGNGFGDSGPQPEHKLMLMALDR